MERIPIRTIYFVLHIQPLKKQQQKNTPVSQVPAEMSGQIHIILES